METQHSVVLTDSREMREISDESIDLVVTSPPYPMIECGTTFFVSFTHRRRCP